MLEIGPGIFGIKNEDSDQDRAENVGKPV